MSRLLLTIATLGTVMLVLTACGGQSPATTAAIEQANRSINATFAARRSATITAITAARGSVLAGDGALSTARTTPTGTVPLRTPLPASPVPTRIASVASAGPPAAVMYERLMAAVANVKTGEISATLDYGNHARTVTAVRFALGQGNDLARTQTTVTYQSTVATRSVEAITIGGQTWQHADGAAWVLTDRADNARDQVRALLPQGGTGTVTAEAHDGAVLLRWYDAERTSSVEVEVDATTGIPRQMRQQSRADGSVLTISYRGWNTPVTITAPSGS